MKKRIIFYFSEGCNDFKLSINFNTVSQRPLFFAYHLQALKAEIEELKRIAFDVDGDPHMHTVRKSQNSAEDYKKLGFEVSFFILSLVTFTVL